MKKKAIIWIPVLLILAIAIAVYCWPVSKVWFSDREQMDLAEVYVYDREITDLLTEEQKFAILDLLEGLESRRAIEYSSNYSMNDYPVSIYLRYALGSPHQDTCQILLGKTEVLWSTLGSARLYRIVDGDALEAQMVELLSEYYD